MELGKVLQKARQDYKDSEGKPKPMSQGDLAKMINAKSTIVQECEFVFLYGLWVGEEMGKKEGREKGEARREREGKEGNRKRKEGKRKGNGKREMGNGKRRRETEDEGSRRTCFPSHDSNLFNTSDFREPKH